MDMRVRPSPVSAIVTRNSPTGMSVLSVPSSLRKPSLDDEPTRWRDLDDVPEALGLVAFRRGHVVLDAAPRSEVVLREGGGVVRRAPPALELARIGPQLPDALGRRVELGVQGHGQGVGVLADGGDGHLLVSCVVLDDESVMRSMRSRHSCSYWSSRRARHAQPLDVGADDLASADALLRDQPGPLEDRDVLLHRREAHRVVARQLGDPLLPVDRAAHDVAAGVVGQGAEHAVEVGRGELHWYNHTVVQEALSSRLPSAEMDSAIKVDVVVALGAGAAGCVVAARLAATSVSVLLVEAGPDLRADPPELVRDGWHMSREFDWGDSAEAREDSDARPVRRVRIVGGTSSITRFAMRGAPGDYDEWEALGNPGWGFDSVLPVFRRIETDLEFGEAPWHGASGPIPVTRYPQLEATEPNEAMAKAFEAGGFPPVEDHNRPGAVGVGRIPMSSRDGIRMTSAAGYLAAGSEPANLTIRAEAQVDRVIVHDARARGVVLVDGTEIRAGTVVVCAGVFGSPPILLRSGIGPADELTELGIEVQSDLPGVGSNLADHPATDIDLGFAGVARAAPLAHGRDVSQRRRPDGGSAGPDVLGQRSRAGRRPAGLDRHRAPEARMQGPCSPSIARSS